MNSYVGAIKIADLHNLFDRNLIVAQSINEVRGDVKSTKRCIAIYLYNKKIVSIGINKAKSHPLLVKFEYDKNYHYNGSNSYINKYKQYPIHAELDGYIKLLNTNLNYNTLFIYRGEFCDLPSSPCYVCANWLKRIDKLRIGYINDRGLFEIVDSKDLIGHHRHRFKDYISYDLSKLNL